MNIKKNRISKLAVKLGYWSSCFCALSFLIYSICFILIMFINPMFTWTDLSNYATYVTNNNQIFKHIAMIFMIVFGVSYVVLLNSIKEYVNDNKKIFANISINFGLVFTALISINYFLQISIVRLNIQKEQLSGLEQFIQSNPTSAIAAINMLGWTIFLGLSSIFIVSVFNDTKLERIIKYSFFVNGVNCFLAGIGFIFHIYLLTFITMFFVLGFTILSMSISLAIFFKKMEQIKFK